MNITLAQDDPRTDTFTRLINAASTEIYGFTSREFISFTNYANPSATETRDFDVSLYGIGKNTIGVGDMQQAPTAVSIKDWNGNAVSSPTIATDVDLFPRIRQEWQPIEFLRFRNGHSIGAYLGAPNTIWPYGDYFVSVTSRWGFPTVPQDVRNDCVETVRNWYDQIFTHSATTEPDISSSVPSRNLPPHVLVSLNKWRALRG
jgi:hypothetical protein